MKEKYISDADILALCDQEETHFFDRKAIGVEGKKVQKIAVAFANAEGGTFVIGISDDKEPDITKRWNAVPNVEAFNSSIQALNELLPTVESSITILRSSSRRGIALQIDIEKSSQVHATADRIVYVRMGASSLPIREPEKVTELAFAKGAKSFEDQAVSDARAEDITESFEISRFLSSIVPTTDALDFIVNQNLVTRDTWTPRVAGILLFSNSPSSLMPKKCAVRISRYETKEDDPERDHLRLAESVEGSLYSLIHDTVKRVSAIMADISIWTSSGLEKVKYPPEAIWEIVANAIIHRDYSISDDVHIRIFNNRIEVVSPGRLPGYVTVDNILDARFSRNPKIVRTLSRYPDPPNKDLGEGLNTAF
jgi:ATP-dependent DNA helicase RecG